MLVTQRMFPEKSVEYIQLRPDMWNDPRLDEPCCASLPVVVDVDAQGDYRPVLNEGVDGRFAILESDVHVGINSDLSLTTRFVNPSEAWLVIPGLDVFTSRRGSARISVVRDDGVAFNRFTKLRGGTNHYANPKIKDSVLVPRDGVIGGTEHYAGTLKASGKYLVTTEIDESIYKDKLFVDGKRVDRELSEWPIVFRSRTTTITVPEKAP